MLHRIVEGLVCGAQIPAEVRPFFAGGSLIALNKGKRDPRPITILVVLRRVCSHALSSVFSEKLGALLQPTQFGVGVPGGCLSFAHSTALLLAANPDWAAVTVDCANAFNTMSRVSIRSALVNHCPELLPFFDSTYGVCGMLKVAMQQHPMSDQQKLRYIRSEEGVQQGDPLSTLFFCLGLQRPILRTMEQHTGVVMEAYIDDAVILGPRAAVQSAFHTFKAELIVDNELVNDEKCHSYSLDPAPLLPELKEHSNLGFMTVKLPFGTDALRC